MAYLALEKTCVCLKIVWLFVLVLGEICLLHLVLEKPCLLLKIVCVVLEKTCLFL